MPYLYETHLHCSQCSACAVSSSQDMVTAYHNAGYAGFVLTDHFIFGNTAVDRRMPWEDQMQCFYQAYLDAKKTAEPLDFDVIFGIEHAYGSGKEVLIYGVELDFLLANPDIPLITIDELVRRVHEWGGVVIQAHPYRERSYINMAIEPRADIVDGIEVYNAGNLPEENIRALRLAGEGDFIITCGGDVHSEDHYTLGHAGIVLPERVGDSKAFAKALKQRRHQFLVGGKTVDVIEKKHLEDSRRW